MFKINLNKYSKFYILLTLFCITGSNAADLLYRFKVGINQDIAASISSPTLEADLKKIYEDAFQTAGITGLTIYTAQIQEDKTEKNDGKTITYTDITVPSVNRMDEINSTVNKNFPTDFNSKFPQGSTSDFIIVTDIDLRTCTIDDKFDCDSLRICQTQVCDGPKDCTSGEDEDTVMCNCADFYCDKKCVKRCDGNNDCSSNEDENECTNCESNAFLCKEESKCISPNSVCDSIPHCKDSSDEDESHCNKCGDDEFYCREDHKCLNSTLVCDGKNDCKYGTDEIISYCPSPCSPGQFRCDVVKCYSSDVVCDGFKHCDDLTDESKCGWP